MNKYILIAMASLFIFSTMPSKSYAGQCTNTKSNYTISAGTITVQRDTPINSYMTQVIQSAPAQVYSGCSGYNAGESDVVGIKAYNKAIGSIDGFAVFESNIPGVGYIIGSHASFVGASGCSFGDNIKTVIKAGKTQQASCAISGDGFDDNSSWEQPFIRLVNMGAGANAGGTLTGIIGYVYGGNGSQGWLREVPVMINGTVNVTSCLVNTPVVNVPLGEYITSEFTAVNHTTPPVPVPVTLDCFAGARINAVVSAEVDTSTTQQGAIKLTSGGASGVAVQVLDRNNAPVKLNQKFVVDTVTADGQYNFNWTARYLQTQSSVTTGDANASATLTMTYE